MNPPEEAQFPFPPKVFISPTADPWCSQGRANPKRALPTCKIQLQNEIDFEQQNLGACFFSGGGGESEGRPWTHKRELPTCKIQPQNIVFVGKLIADNFADVGWTPPGSAPALKEVFINWIRDKDGGIHFGLMGRWRKCVACTRSSLHESGWGSDHHCMSQGGGAIITT